VNCSKLDELLEDLGRDPRPDVGGRADAARGLLRGARFASTFGAALARRGRATCRAELELRRMVTVLAEEAARAAARLAADAVAAREERRS
jgi:hypothetical protein